jgi:hypothetical protein
MRVVKEFWVKTYKTIGCFLGTWPGFNPLHMLDVIDDAKGTYKQYGFMPNDAINLNDDFMTPQQTPNINFSQQAFKHSQNAK